MKRVAIVGVLVMAGIAGVHQVGAGAQELTRDAGAAQAPAQAAPPQRQVPPVLKALNEASALKDVDLKIAAIQKVIADFSKTPQVDQANALLLDAYIKKGDQTRAQGHAKAMIAAAAEATRPRIQRDVASALLRGGVLLEDAETYAKAAVEALPDEKTYVDARKQEAALRAASAARPFEGGGGSPGAAMTAPPMPSTAASAGAPAVAPQGGGTVVGSSSGGFVPMSDELLVTRYKGEKQSALSTLGQIYARRGKQSEAEKALREAYLLDKKTPAAATAALKLAEYAKTAGRDQEQFEYLSGVALAGRLTPDAYADFQSVYRKTHNGSLDGLEESLDTRYETEGPKAPDVKPYARAADRADRIVLAEIFTGAGCGPCVAADLAFESAMHRYGPTELAVLMYHLHVPRPDPMTNSSTQARAKFYAVSGVPTYVIDGEARSGGGSAENAGPLYKRSVEPVIDKRLSTRSDVTLALTGHATGQAVSAVVSVSPGASTAPRLRLHVVLVEEQIRYSGENGIRFHPMVVRSMAVEPAVDATNTAKSATLLPAPGFALEPGKARKIEYTFDLAAVTADGLANLEDLEKNSTRFPNHKFLQKKHEINPARLSVVAFVQDEDTKQVLQAAKAGLGR